jgi:DNA-binding transcriptional regulator YiaG
MDWPIQMDWPLLLPSNESLELPPLLRFSEFVAMHRALLISLTKDLPEPELPATWLQPYLLHWLRLHKQESKLNTAVAIVENAFALSAHGIARSSAPAAGLLKKYHKAKLALRESIFPEASEAGEKKLLPDVTETGNIANVKSQMESLLAAVKMATSKRGMKTSLAKAMGVPLSNVSQWLSGDRKPGGERVLQLLQWVEQQEHQQKKGSGSAATRPEPATQSKASNEKTPKSGRNKP